MNDFDPWRGTPSSITKKNILEDAYNRSERFDPFGIEDLKASLGKQNTASDLSTDSLPVIGRPPSILTVCTGNICRSPYFERVLGTQLKMLGVRVSSAGTDAIEGRPMDPNTEFLLNAQDLESSGFMSRPISEKIVLESDLVLTATRDHRRAVVQSVPSALSRVFALSDFADLCSGIDLDATRSADSENFISDLVRAANARRSFVPVRSNESADILDPYRKGHSAFVEMQHQSLGYLNVIAEAVKHAHR